MNDDRSDIPKPSKGDAIHAAVKAGLSAVPALGGPAAEIFQFVIQPPLERRRYAWMRDVGDRLAALEREGISLAELRENDEFISAVMHASQIAMRTHREEKLLALSNAICNVARGQGPEEALQHFFLEVVDSLTELHLRILALFREPSAPPNITTGSLVTVLERGIPELKGQRDVYDQFWRDLYTRGLVNTDGLHTMITAQGMGQKRTSELGDLLLDFISGEP